MGRRANDADEMLAKYVTKTESCWIWTGKIHKGYGLISIKDRTHYMHRVSYEKARGPIPDGMDLDHLCRNRACVNPDHLEPVTHAENMRRRVISPVFGVMRTHCRLGHAFVIKTVASGGLKNYCPSCHRIASLKHERSRGSIARGTLTHCHLGHALETRRRGNGVCRYCRTCQNARQKARRSSG